MCILLHSHIRICIIHIYKLIGILPERNCYFQNFYGERCHFLQHIVKFHNNIAGACYQQFIIYVYLRCIYFIFLELSECIISPEDKKKELTKQSE